MITIFTGAGASRALRYPTTGEFFTTGKGKQLQQDNVYQNALGYLQKNILDVEDILRLLYPFVALKGSPTGDFIYKHLSGHWLSNVPNFVTRTNSICFDHYGRVPTESEVKQLYMPVLDLCKWQKDSVSIFTTNYDPVTDVIMELAESNNIQSYDGFNRFGTWDSGGYSKVKSSGIGVYRLHGSMSWVEINNGIRNTRDYSRREPGSVEHLIIYPGYKGNPEIEGHSAFRFAHTALRKELGETSAVLIIGFSFRDPHLNDIFHEALTTNQKLRMVVWNPEWPEGSEVGLGELKQEFEPRISHLPHPFGDAKALPVLKELLSI
ncbi:MAG TPA: SIR2 family protein [Geobacteraceae bacterium]